MAFIDDDQVKGNHGGTRDKDPAGFIPSDRLIDCEINIAAFDGFTASDLVSRVAERTEILRHRIIDQHVAVGRNSTLVDLYPLNSSAQTTVSADPLKATAVLPAPVHRVSKTRFLP